ncbi:hypothetical protein RclHR1_28810002 [Rhizophagus clarus]|uniref:Uncharacterized protein n=1 Tax=Rhizophagus clarus TaxID=94130 RepID=A0A2Z6R7R9_9GLOM|nr:hypothetical protein RclHR1_28810002 [Rhizophagus clarus]
MKSTTRLLKLRHDWTIGIKVRVSWMLPDKKHDWTIGIKHDRTIGIKVREVLLDEKHDQTIRIKIREVLLDEKHDRTIGIKCCQMKSITGLLELSVAG